MKLVLLIAAIVCAGSAYAQDPARFKTQIERLQGKEHSFDESRELIVFTGSSSIVRWKTVESDFPDYNVINHGFGGSQFGDLAFYYEDLIKKHAPDILFVYEGDNDIAAGKEPRLVFQQAKELFATIRKDLPQTRIAVISPKPCLANWDKRQNYVNLNAQLETYCREHENFDFINVWDLMIDSNGIVLQDIFVGDGDHMNSRGYRIWIKAVNDYLEQSPE